MDGQPLFPHAINLLRLMDFDALNQLIQHLRRQLLGPCVFADGGDEHIRSNGPAAQLVNLRAERLNLLGKLFLLPFVPAGHFGEALIAELAGNIVLIDIFVVLCAIASREKHHKPVKNPSMGC